MKKMATIHKIAIRLKDAFEALGYDIDMPRLETLSTLILRSMTGRSRVFHDYEHIFDVAGASGPHETIAALYHDVVYYQVDRGFPPVTRRLLEPFMFDEHGCVRLRTEVPQEECGFWMCLKIFGLNAGQEVSVLQGLNEFLSAVICTQQISSFVSKKDLVKIIACIEVTIPFRKPTSPYPSVVHSLLARIQETGNAFGIRFTAQDLDQIGISAVTISNNDLESFALNDPGEFLSHTWRLLPESNITLQFPEQHTIRDYRLAIQKMYGFFRYLNPSTVFHCYKDFPSEIKYQKMQRAATVNIHMAVKYLEVILVATSVLEAIAHVTGGDLPMAMMMGDVGNKKIKAHRMEDFLPSEKIRLPATHNKTLMKLFMAGRNKDSQFDTRHSPLAAYLYPRLSLMDFETAIFDLSLMFENRMTPNHFLATFPQEIITHITHACAQISITRAERLKTLAKELKSKGRKAG